MSTVSCAIDKSYLLDVFTKLYIATDSNPVDSHTYELCSDLVDVVIDVSYIYGLSIVVNNGLYIARLGRHVYVRLPVWFDTVD